ncbi:MAG: coproporphyrinogen III oxidase, partial [Alphaproteobacteria bacterium]|nr:coproporphyrinogen III oxidase [Alphaproteobacteria bacterium]
FERAVRRGRIAPPPAEAAADLYALTQALCDAAGAPAYEVSNHARGPAAHARHNRLYWEGADWLGLGPGAHGRVPLEGTRTATVAARTPAAYVAAVAANGVGWAETEPLDPVDEAEERLMMGLRLLDGVALAPLEARRGRPFARAALDNLTRAGLTVFDGLTLRVTAEGRLLTDRIAREVCLAP